MRVLLVILFAATTSVAPPSARAQPDQKPTGATLRFVMRDGARHAGELLAAQDSSAWLLQRDETRPILLRDVARVQVRGQGLGPVHLLIWTAVGGVATGAALTGACQTVSEGCGGVFAGSLLIWGLVGGLAAAITGSPHRWIEPQPNKLAPYARFPQGLPERFLDD